MLRGAKQQRRKRARAEDSDAEEDVADTAPEQEGSGLQPLASDEMEAALQDFGVAEQKGYWLQLTVLEKIASHRRAGVLRSEMAKAVNMDAKSFHYIATALEARGLIGSVQEMIQGAPAGPKLTLTSRLFLRRFLPRVVVQIEADVEAQQVVEALAACPDQTAVESDMKARLGYWEKDGRAKDPEISRRKHRKWRYTRERLIRSGQLEQFKGTVDVPSRSGEGTEKRTINFIRLLATQTPESKALALMPEDEAEGLEEPEIVAELGLNGQIMRRILQAGEEGVTRVSVAQSLGLTSKRANRSLAAFAAKYHIRENFAQRGKAQIKMWKAPAALLAAHESTHSPPVPPGGWVAAVRRAVAPLEAEMTAADIPHPSDQPSSSQGAGENASLN
ncbi:g83 [Coccomyxa viridis]|uniref:G83 protein n=1 Tax=Coccomyxa viridis TaxID=1274662 RepID=A0ABP1FK60_9CHLO